MTTNNLDDAAESERLEAVRDWGVLELEGDETLDEIVKIAALSCSAPVAMIGFMDADRQWFKAKQGWSIESMPRHLSFCNRAIEQFGTVMIADTQRDPELARHPLVTGPPNIRFYAGAPLITAEGHVLGTLSVFDSVPRSTLNPTQKRILESLAKEVISALIMRRDVSELEKRARETTDVKHALAETQERLHDLFESVDDFILTISTDGRLMHVNRSWLDTFAYSREEIARVSIFDIVNPDMRSEFVNLFRRVVATGRPETIETVFLTNHGRRITVEGKLSPRVLEGRSSLVRVIFRDVSERKQFEVELGKARDAALESARLKSQFLTNVSHEIRTPMNAIVGMLQLLLDSKLDAEQTEFARTALSSADELLSIISNILQVSKLEAGRLAKTLSDFDLINTATWIVEVMKVAAAEKNLSMSMHLDENLPAVVYGDVSAVRQVLTNLLNNAVKFTEHGSIRVELRLERETDTHLIVRFEITDTGMGIAEDALGRIFESFTQVDGSMTRKYGGVGLGLSTSKQLVDLMGGVIGVESKVLRGSTFWFSIPFEKRTARAERFDFTGTRVLVLDQSVTSRKIVVHYLESTLRMRCDTATSPVDALEMLRNEAAVGDPFRVAIFDLHMPAMHGLALAGEIKGDSSIAATSLISMISLGEQVDDDLLREVGISAYIQKPVEQAELLDAVTIVMASELRPARKVLEAPVPVEATPSVLPMPPAEGVRRVLLAEDNALNQKLTRSQLVRLGYEVDIVANGAEVLRKIQEQYYPVILMDCQMPEMDGYEATIQLRRLEGATRRIRIIAMTAHALEGDREKCLAAGMDDYLSKPTRQEDLANALARWTQG
ncbi:MAG: response regulator [Thermoanaerobaculia bacterium]|nr:response regulator [Thermoanaerobaculia bacterium]